MLNYIIFTLFPLYCLIHYYTAMRLISLTLCIVVFTVGAKAQPWLENLPAGKPRQELTFFDYQRAFETYWAPYLVENGTYIENGETKKAPGWKQFKRWEYLMEHRVDMKTGSFPEQTALEITRAYQQNHPSGRGSDQSNWISLGPASTPGGHEGIGRMNCVAFHPTNLNTYWAGAASGGLWYTDDDGATWTCLTDKEESLGVTDIIIPTDYDQSQTIYIATGDRDSYDNNSIGVLKSTDGGLTWNATGLQYTLSQRKFINRLIQHPTVSGELIAATTDGVYRTTDGGATWDAEVTDHVFIDIEFHPDNPEIIYGSNFEGELYVSLNNGASWTRTLNDFAGKRVEIAVTPAAPDWVYAVTESGGLDGIYKSVDKGLTFTKTLSGDTLNLLHWNSNGIGDGGQGYYDLGIAASPIDPNILLVGGINTWRSHNGGTHWSIVNVFAGGQVQIVHADKHSLRFRPNGDLWECNDGGIYVSYDHGDTWIDKTNGIAISQMYRLGVSATDPDEVVTGLQDNGSKLHSGTGWQHVNSGDGMEGIIDHTDNNIQYTTTQSGSLFRTLDRWTSARYIKPNAAGGGAWVTPYAMDPQDPRIIYGGFKEIWKTTDRGDTWTQVSTISHGDKIRSIAIAPSDPNTLYVAGTYFMYKSTTGGEPFVRLTGNVPDHTNSMAYISVKHDDPQTVWVAVSGFTDPGVYESKDGGATWTNISEGLPKIPAYTVIQNKQAVDEIELIVGTELGVFIKKGSEPWMPFGNGLPNVIVMELEMHYASDPTQSKLRAATYGRGLWETKVAFVSSPMTFVSSTTKQDNTSSIKPNQPAQEIIKIQINTSGDLAPLSARSFSFDTGESSNPLTDITLARVYYTGGANGFSTTTPFGDAYVSPKGDFTINGEQEMINGTNYFWLAYDVSASATVGNILDAACTSLNIGMDVTPEETNPEGHRLIELIYCDAGGTHLSQEHISLVTIGSVQQSSEDGMDGYQDFTATIAELMIGVSTPVTVQNNVPFNSDELIIWADWNIDGDFEDEDEQVYKSGPLGITTYTTSITPPAHAKPGLTRLRIRLHDTAFGSNATPCGNANLGEVEDYTIDVKEETVGVKQVEGSRTIIVYPNPMSEELTLEYPDNQTSTPFRITDVLGQTHQQGYLTEKTIILTSKWVPGIYFVHAGFKMDYQARVIKF